MDNQAKDRIRNLEFKMQFSQTNLFFLYGSPDSEEKARCIELNKKGIQDAKQEIERIKGELNHSADIYK